MRLEKVQPGDLTEGQPKRRRGSKDKAAAQQVKLMVTGVRLQSAKCIIMSEKAAPKDIN